MVVTYLTADDWSLAISRHITGDLAPGSTVYLSIDEGVLDHIAGDGEWPGSGAESFLEAVRDQLRVPFASGEPWTEAKLRIPSPQSVLGDGTPACTAFLSFLVLCASKCGDPIPGLSSDNTFFPYVKQLLGGVPSQTRSGLGGLQYASGQRAPELQRWHSWDRFVTNLGFNTPAKTKHGVGRQYWGLALDQVILTSADRKFLSDQSDQMKRQIRNALTQAEKGIFRRVPLFERRTHLSALWERRWADNDVTQALRNGLDGVPGCRNPVRLRYERLETDDRTEYSLRLILPSAWQRGTRIVLDGRAGQVFSLLEALESNQRLLVCPPNTDARETSFQRRYYRFVEDETKVGPASSERLPELYEPHWMLIPASLVPEFENLADQASVVIGRIKSISGYDGWVELADFALCRPSVLTSLGELSVRNRTRVWIEGGVTSGERGFGYHQIVQAPGFIFASAPIEILIDGWFHLRITPESPMPVPDELGVGDHVLSFDGTERRFELIDWREVSGPSDYPTGWVDG
jgi:hypothetical protein